MMHTSDQREKLAISIESDHAIMPTLLLHYSFGLARDWSADLLRFIEPIISEE